MNETKCMHGSPIILICKNPGILNFWEPVKKHPLVSIIESIHQSIMLGSIARNAQKDI